MAVLVRGEAPERRARSFHLHWNPTIAAKRDRSSRIFFGVCECDRLVTTPGELIKPLFLSSTESSGLRCCVFVHALVRRIEPVRSRVLADQFSFRCLEGQRPVCA